MKTINIIRTLLVIVLLSSCSHLDFDETDGLKSEEDVYKYFNSTEQVLTNVYSFLPQDLGTISGAMRDCATDDAEFAATGGAVQSFNNGSWSPLNSLDNQWDLYKGIRAANKFLVNIEDADFTRFEHNIDYNLIVKKLSFFPYEARLLRAFYFFELARRYGDIAMPITVLTTDEANNIQKTKFNDVINFIVAECNEAALNLPDTYKGVTEQTGRVTKGFAYALKSKALLYAASPLHNPSNDINAWKASAKAALDLIDLNYYNLENAETANRLDSKEAVLFRLNNENSYFELINFPLRYTKGGRHTPATATFPSQNLVDAFETINGYPVILQVDGWKSDDPAFDPKNPYANRDPRLARAVLTDGAMFKGSEIETYFGGTDYAPVAEGGSPTGYFLKKYIQPEADFTPGNLVTKRHLWVIYRYAETLLTYAESMIEAFGDANYTDATYTRSALWAINEVRLNAGMPLVTPSSTQDFRDKVRNEWRVEFAFEDHRFWDIRRWKIGNNTQEKLYGVSINKKDDGTKTYQKTLYETRSWSNKMYLYPIPQDEIFKNPNLAPQNQGW
ncbi:RagB/SusD family nutrient uptake outer membrane protein [Wocania ichthyoenteri]|uniref:RagB/SusD family nutrient uptake outer membrane protein n=1 Tax=Wocania ichthyoenteri TaxID=1230531 RepID=UPI00053E25B4|nr:RagB/SusD family nutrient uptake outer membrane protein [Wocania ichthyoenteri]